MSNSCIHISFSYFVANSIIIQPTFNCIAEEPDTRPQYTKRSENSSAIRGWNPCFLEDIFSRNPTRISRE